MPRREVLLITGKPLIILINGIVSQMLKHILHVIPVWLLKLYVVLHLHYVASLTSPSSYTYTLRGFMQVTST